MIENPYRESARPADPLAHIKRLRDEARRSLREGSVKKRQEYDNELIFEVADAMFQAIERIESLEADAARLTSERDLYKARFDALERDVKVRDIRERL